VYMSKSLWSSKSSCSVATWKPLDLNSASISLMTGKWTHGIPHIILPSLSPWRCELRPQIVGSFPSPHRWFPSRSPFQRYGIGSWWWTSLVDAYPSTSIFIKSTRVMLFNLKCAMVVWWIRVCGHLLFRYLIRFGVGRRTELSPSISKSI